MAVHDLSNFQPFEGAANRTAVLIVGKKKRAFPYPVPYTVWKKTVRGKIASELQLHEVRAATARTKLAAQPVQGQIKTSPWLTAPKRALSGIQKVIGQSDYKAHEGVNTGGLNGCFWVRVLEKQSNGKLLIENMHDVGKIRVKQEKAVIEPDLVYPLLRGKDVQRWYAEPSAYIILANRTDKLAGIPQAEMKRRWRETYAYLKRFEGNPQKPERGTLRGRSVYRQFFKPTDPFYSMFGIGPYTMAEWKVLWPEVGHSVRASVSGPSTVEKVKPSLPDHTIVAVSCSSESEGYFVAGMLNSSPAYVAIAAYIVLHPSPHIMKNIAVPQFKKADSNHTRLAKLSSQCHAAKRKNRQDEVATLEAEIDEVAAGIWGISDVELKAIQKALADM